MIESEKFKPELLPEFVPCRTKNDTKSFEKSENLSSGDDWLSFDNDVDAPRTFVPPRVETIQESDACASGVPPALLLISASAATGKSFYAKNLSAKTKNPLIDLSKDLQVGSNYFRGGLSKILDEKSSKAIQEIRTGKACLIVDGLDEAMISVAPEAFQAGILDLLSLIRPNGPQNHVGAVVFGRQEAIERAAILADSTDLPWKMFKIAFFGRDERVDFVLELVEKRISGIEKERLRPAVKNVFSVLSIAMENTDEEQDSVLGYAPVLEAISRLFTIADVATGLNSSSQIGAKGDVWETLREILYEILLREQYKLEGNLSTEDRCYGSSVYSPLAQVRYLFANDIDQPEVEFEDAYLGEDRKASITRHVREQLEIHPYLMQRAFVKKEDWTPMTRFVNVVFRDFALSLGICNDDELTVIQSMELKEAAAISISPLFARFIVGQFQSAVLSGQSPLVDPEVFGLVSESAARVIGGQGEKRVLSMNASQGVAMGNRFISVLLDENSSFKGNVDFWWPGDGRLDIGRALGRSTLLLPDLSLETSAGGSFEMHPPIVVNCNRFTMYAEAPLVPQGAAEEGKTISLNCRFVGGSTRDFSISKGLLEIRVDKAAYPWSSYRVGDYLAPAAWERIHVVAAQQLRKLVMWFGQRRMTGAFTYPIGGADVLLANNRMPEDWFKFLIHRDYIVRDDNVYRLSLPVPPVDVLDLNMQSVELKHLVGEFLEHQ